MHRRVGRALALSAFSMLWLLDPSGLTRLEATVTQAVAVERIVGSWRVRIVGEGSDTPLFAVATATSDRTIVITGGIPTASVGHGLWRKLGREQFVVKFLYFRFDDETGALIGSAAVEVQGQHQEDRRRCDRIRDRSSDPVRLGRCRGGDAPRGGHGRASALSGLSTGSRPDRRRRQLNPRTSAPHRRRKNRFSNRARGPRERAPHQGRRRLAPARPRPSTTSPISIRRAAAF